MRDEKERKRESERGWRESREKEGAREDGGRVERKRERERERERER